MRLRERRVPFERRLVRGDGARDVAGVGELDAALQQRARIVAQRVDAREHAVLDGRPLRAEPRVAFERPLRLVAPGQRAKGQRERVVGRAELREERDRALAGVRRPLRGAPRCRDASEAELRRGSDAGVSANRSNSRLLSSSCPASSSASASLTRAGR